MSFVQIIDFRSSRIDDILRIDQEWIKATEAERAVASGARRTTARRRRAAPIDPVRA